ncbi:hypothetical protein ACQY0O_007326 [Thecaphora frezii]
MPSGAAYAAVASGYPPPSPSSPYYQDRDDQRTWSAEPGRSYTPSSRTRGGDDHYAPPRSPLLAAGAAHGYHVESDDYEERDLGEIATANQAAQERSWGPHTALSEAAEQAVGMRPGEYYRPPSGPHYELEPYDGGYYLEAPATYTPHEFGARPGVSSPSVYSGQTLGGGSRRSLPAYRSPSVQPSITSPASEPPNIFNVTARHHLPGSRSRPDDAYDPHRSYPGPGNRDELPGFPPWSPAWYGGHHSADGHAYTMVPPGSQQSGWESETLSNNRAGHGGPYGPFPYGYAANDPRMAERIKEERIRMLEKEFGPKITHKGKGKAADNDSDDDNDDEDADKEDELLPIGSVDPRGKLVLPRRKLRIAVRCLQCLLSLACAACGIGGALLAHPTEDPPPKNALPTWALYIVSVLSTIVCLWLFALRPMCVNPLRKVDRMSGGAGGNNMVIPVLGGGGSGGAGGGGLFGRRNKMRLGRMQAGPTVNLIVDPSLLGQQRSSHSDSDSDASDKPDYLPGENRRRRLRKRRARRQSLLGTMRAQALWQFLRRWIKVALFLDVVFALLWLMVAVWAIGWGKTCKIGSFQGWCNAYDGALACAATAAVACIVAIYIGVGDLKASSKPPRRV